MVFIEQVNKLNNLRILIYVSHFFSSLYFWMFVFSQIQLQINVMINLDQLIETLQQKIIHYRKAQRHFLQARTTLHPSVQQLLKNQLSLAPTIQNTFQLLKTQATQTVTTVAYYYQNLLDKQKQVHHYEVQELRTQVGRQYKLIALMRKELEDLMQLMSQKKNEDERQINKTQEQIEPQQHPSNQRLNSQNTINGLQVIQQEETQRTLMSSVHSMNQEYMQIQKDNFIKIEEVSKYSSRQQSIHRQDSQHHFQQEYDHRNATNNSQESEWASNCKFEGLMESAASQNIHTDQNQEGPCQWQSMPVSVQGPGRQNLWQMPNLSHQLKEITNQGEHQRQKKTKLFLQEFRKTFDKCLFTNVSRKSSKSSKGNQGKPPKDKIKSNASLPHNEKILGKSNQNQKLINQMLRDIDNNTKFFVGNRKSQVRYQGQKKDGSRSGQGVLYYSNGLCYEGQFKNNFRHGMGVLRFNQIQIYRGIWAADQLSGQGKIRNFAVINKRKTQNNSVLSKWVSYSGSFKGNRFQGEGTLYLQGGQKFFGKFICGSACGQGSLFKKNGEVETGVWRNNELVEQF